MVHQVCFIGAGAMGSAIIQGLLRNSTFKAADIIACDPDTKVLHDLERELRIDISTNNKERIEDSRTIFLAINRNISRKFALGYALQLKKVTS